MSERLVIPGVLAVLLWGGAGRVGLADSTVLPHASAQGPALGEPISRDEVAAVDFTVLPDGTGLPEGEGSVAQGLEVYQRACRLCHGEGGQGGPNDRLVGGAGSLTSDAPVKTIGSYWPYATTVFDYIRRAMPHQAPGSLTSDEIYALTAYLLNENGIIADDAVLNAQNLPRVQMPNRAGFVWGVRPN